MISKVIAPIANKHQKELKLHGHVRQDPYHWMNQRDDEEVLEYLNAENDFTKGSLAHLDAFKESLFQEIVARIKQTDMSVPYKLDQYFYYTRYEEGKEHPVFCRKKDSLENIEEIILDVNILAENHDYFQVVGLKVSHDHSLLAFGVDTTGRRQFEIRFRKLSDGSFLEDKIPNTTGGIAWANDNTTIFYSVKDESLRPCKVVRHTLGKDVTADVEIYHEKDETFTTYVYKTKSKKYIVIGSHSTNSTEFSVLSSDDPNGKFRVFQDREKNHEYGISHYEDKFFVVTNWDSKNFRLMETPEFQTDKANWKEVIPNREEVLLEGIEIFKDYMVVEERIKGLTALRVVNNQDGSEYSLLFDEATYTIFSDVNPDFNTNIFRFGYNSLTTPQSIYDFDMSSKNKTLLKREEVVGNFSPDDYVSERYFANAKDGREIPISLVYKKGFEKNGKAPCFLTGYGSYGYSYDPYFSSVRLSLLDRGFVFAIAHIRGGEEMGRHWYEEGRMLNKKNTFSDFICASEYLIENNFTSSEGLAISGGSAGGLLIGAVINMRPELYKVALAAVPFVDVVTTMLDTSIPLTTGEYDEWGNPNDKAYYDYILSYSPYDNIETKSYPNLMVTTGYTDSQVQYWEPAKWVAKLRELKTDNNQLLFYCEMEAGHSGKSGRFERYKLIALEYTFLLHILGLTS